MIEMEQIDSTNQIDDLTKSLNQSNSDLQVCTEDKKQLEKKVDDLNKQILELEDEKLKLKNDIVQWEQQYNITMELLYKGAFSLMSVYNSRRIDPLEQAQQQQ